MRKILPYDKFSILEWNKTVGFFRENPHLLSSHAKDIPKKRNVEWDPERVGAIDRDAVKKKKADVFSRLRRKLSGIRGIDKPFYPDKPDSWTILDVLVGSIPGKEEFYNWKEMWGGILECDNVEKFVDRVRYWNFPMENYSNRKPISSYVNFYDVLHKNYEEIREQIRRTRVALDNIKDSEENRLKNNLMKMGLSLKDVEIAMSYITDWTSMSQKRLDPSVWPLLKKLSVDPSRLPKTIYRGMFIDGVKIKNREEFMEQWSPGSKPGASLRKATSWSVDRGTAAEFMSDQDNIKDQPGGFYVLLRWDVDPSEVVADLRNLPVDHKFWNQQEIIISPKVKDYVVDTIIPGKDGYDTYRSFVKSIKSGQGGYGHTRSEFARNFLNTPYETLSPEHRIEFKRVAKMTVGEFKEVYPGSRINDEWDEVAMPLLNFVTRYMNASILKKEKTRIEFQYRYTIHNLRAIGDPTVKEIVEEEDKKSGLNYYTGTYQIKSNVGVVELLADDYYRMRFRVTIPTTCELVQTEHSTGSEMEKNADLRTRNIFEKIGSEKLVEIFNKRLSGEKFSKNIIVEFN
jgi:hypothetical protein